jgi:putative oxidoreductase
MKQIIPSRIASIIYALAIGTFGVLHFMNAEEMKSGVPDFIPGGIAWIYITGACLILAALAIIINKYTRLACYLLALMLLVFIVTIHLKHLQGGNYANVLKDAAMAMAAILIGNNSEN